MHIPTELASDEDLLACGEGTSTSMAVLENTSCVSSCLYIGLPEGTEDNNSKRDDQQAKSSSLTW